MPTRRHSVTYARIGPLTLRAGPRPKDVLEEVVNAGGAYGALQPQVQLGEVGAGADLTLACRRNPDVTAPEDREN